METNDTNGEYITEYTGESCPNCGKVRIIHCRDGKDRCAKCSWCVRDNDYDLSHEFLT